MNECFLKGTRGKWLGIRIIGVNWEYTKTESLISAVKIANDTRLSLGAGIIGGVEEHGVSFR